MARILVVDDEHSVRHTLRFALEKAEHEVEEAQDGDEALRKFRSLKPDLVLTDIVMPNREGVETIAELRKLDPNLPIIGISGGGSIGGTLFLDLAEQLGATATMAKPIRAANLLALVDECLARRGAVAG